MKKLIILILIFLVSLNFINAIGFSTILMVGNQLGLQVPGEFQETINTLVCASDPISCMEGKIVGEFKSEIYNALPPDVKEAYNTYGQIQGYYSKFEQAVNTINKLSVDGNGVIKDGKIEFGDNQLIELRGVKPEYNKDTGDMTYTFAEENSIITLNEKYSYTNVKPADEKTSAYLKFDENGDVISADMTTNEKGSTFVFGDKKINVPANTQITYDGNNIVMYGEAGKKADVDFLAGFDPEQSQIPSKYSIEYGKTGTVVFTGTGLEISSSVKVTDKDLGFSVTNTAGRNLFLTDDERNTHLYDNWIVANKNLVKYDTTSTLELLPGNNWMKDVNENNKMLLALNGGGSIYSNELHVASGQVISLTSSKDCNSEITYTTKDVILGKENDVSCVPMIATATSGNERYIYTANKEGSAITEMCTQTSTTSTGSTIFDVITGNFMKWITGKFDVGQASFVCTHIITQDLNLDSIRCINKNDDDCPYLQFRDRSVDYGYDNCCYDLNSLKIISDRAFSDKLRKEGKSGKDVYNTHLEKIAEEEKERFKEKPEKPIRYVPPERPSNSPLFKNKRSEIDYSCFPDIDNSIIRCREGFFSPEYLGKLYDKLAGIPKFEFYRELGPLKINDIIQYTENGDEIQVWIWKLRSGDKIINCGVNAEEEITQDNICYQAIFGNE